jgi:hypothetical protein
MRNGFMSGGSYGDRSPRGLKLGGILWQQKQRLMSNDVLSIKRKKGKEGLTLLPRLWSSCTRTGVNLVRWMNADVTDR